MLVSMISKTLVSPFISLIKGTINVKISPFIRNFGLLYTDKHEWIDCNEGIGKVGISNYAQDKLGDIVYVELPEIGAKFKKSDKCAEVESVKAASEVYSPVSGKVIQINSNLKNCSLINKSPEMDGWFFTIELSNQDELKSLMSPKEYEIYLNSEDD